jgi:hypothetical protein
MEFLFFECTAQVTLSSVGSLRTFCVLVTDRAYIIIIIIIIIWLYSPIRALASPF